MVQFSNAWLSLLVDVSLKSLALGAFAAVTLAILRIRNMNIRHRVWTAVLVGMVSFPLLVHVTPSVPLPSWMTVKLIDQKPNDGESQQTAFDQAAEVPVNLESPLENTLEPSQAAVDDHFEDVSPTDAEPAATPFATAPAAPELLSPDLELSAAPATASTRPSWRWQHALLGIVCLHAAVACILLLRIAVGLLLTYRLGMEATEVDEPTWRTAMNVRLLQSDRTSVPVTIGFLRPKVVLPTQWRGWPEQKIHSVLAHELAHVRRADWLVTILSEINRAIHWFNPLAWFLRRELAELAEYNCDDAVIEARGDRAEYARHLLEVASALSAAGARYRPPLHSVAMARKPVVETRIDAILDDSRPLAKRLGRLGITCLLAVVVPAIFFAAALSATSQPGKDDTSGTTPPADGEVGNATVRGRVLSPNGQPAPNVEVVLAKIDEPELGHFQKIVGFGVIKERFRQTEIARTKTDENGEFRISVEQEFPNQTLMNLGATASHHGLCWMTNQWKALQGAADVELQLFERKDIHGRIVDLEGNPVSGLEVDIASIYRPQADQSIEDWIHNAGKKVVTDDLHEMAFHRERFGDQYPVDWMHGPLRQGNPVLPKVEATDEQGRFKIAGLGKDQLAFLVFRRDGIATTSAQVVARIMKPVVANPSAWSALRSPSYYGAEMTFVVEGSRPIVGRVTDEDSGEPLSGIAVRLARYANSPMYQEGFLACKTDENGEYRLEGAPLDEGHLIEAVPSDDQPFFPSEAKTSAADSGQGRADLKLKQGVWIGGKVDWGDTEPGPVYVNYYPLLSNNIAPSYGYDSQKGAAPRDKSRCDENGNFRILGIPGDGVVVARERSGQFLSLRKSDVPENLRIEDGDRELNVFEGIWPISGFHAIAAVHATDGEQSQEVRLSLTAGMRRSVRLVDEDGSPVRGALVAGLAFPSTPQQLVEGDHFELVGMRAGEPRLLAIAHEGRRLGRILQVETTDKPLVVKLRPCAVVRGRVVDQDGDAVENVRVRATCESDSWSPQLGRRDTDAAGQFEFILPPGGKCRLAAYSIDGKSPAFSATFDTKPSQVYSLGDLVDGTKLDAKTTARLATIPVAVRSNKQSAEDQHRYVYAGQVVTPSGQPAAGAEVRLVYWYSDNSQTPRDEPDAITDKDGRFRFEMNRGDFYRTGDSVPPWLWASLAVTKDGYGLAWAPSVALEQTGAALREMTDPSNPAVRHTTERIKKMMADNQGPLRLPEDTAPITGKVVTTEGVPVTGVRVSLLRCYTGGDDTLEAWQVAIRKPRADFYSARQATPKHVYGPLARKLVPTVTTDAKGQFILRGIGTERLVQLLFESPAIESADVYCRTQRSDKIELASSRQSQSSVIFGSAVSHVTTLSKPVTGIVRDESTGKPCAGVAVSSMRWTTMVATGQSERAGSNYARTVTDDDGRYTLTGLPKAKKNPIRFAPPADAGLISRMSEVDTTGNDMKAVDLSVDLAKGVLVAGRVVDDKTGEGVSGQVQYLRAQADADKPAVRTWARNNVEDTRADTDGRFRIVVPSGKGYLTFRAFDDTYQKKAHRPENATTMSATGFLAYRGMDMGPKKPEFHAAAEFTLADDTPAHQLEMKVSRGTFVRGTVVDANGAPVSGHYSGRNEYPQWMPLDGAQFTVASYDPKFPRRLTFVSDDRKLAGSVVLSETVAEPLTVKLQPAATLKGRIIDEHGDGLPDVMMHAGNSTRMIASSPGTATPPPELPLPTIDNRHEAFMTDDEGRFTIEGLVAGEPYNIMGFRRKPGDFESPVQGDVAVDIVIGPGKTHDLGNIELKKPDFEKLRRQFEEAEQKRAAEAKAKLKSEKPDSDEQALQDEFDRAAGAR